jgi:hypothetical protein
MFIMKRSDSSAKNAKPYIFQKNGSPQENGLESASAHQWMLIM